MRPAVADDVVEGEAAARAPSGPAAAARRARAAPPRRGRRAARLLAPAPQLRLALRGEGRGRSTGSGGWARAAAITCTGVPSTSCEGGAQRLVAAATSPSARSSAGVQRAPGAAPRVGCCRPGAPGLQRSRNQSRCWAKESGRGRSRGTAPAAAHHGAARAPQRLHALRPGGGGGMVEDARRRQLHAERVAHPRHQAGGQERVAAQREEVVVRAHALHAQHLRPDPRQHLLGRGARGHVALFGRRELRRRERRGPACRWGSAGARPGPRTRPAPCTPGGSAAGARAARPRPPRPPRTPPAASRRRPGARTITTPRAPLRARRAPPRSRPAPPGSRAPSPGVRAAQELQLAIRPPARRAVAGAVRAVSPGRAWYPRARNGPPAPGFGDERARR
jgi:hypothetical protein